MLVNFEEFKKDSFFELLKAKTRCTPDIFELKSEYGEMVPLFVYDKLQNGQEDGYYLSEYPYFGTATSFHEEFYLTKHKGDDILFERDEFFQNRLKPLRSHMKRVQGDVYGVPLDMIYFLDTQFNNGEDYTRTTLSVMLNQQADERNPKGYILRNCQVYLGNLRKIAQKHQSPWELSQKFFPGVYIQSKFYDEKVYHNTRS